MPSTLTYTGKTGPAVTVTAQTTSNVSKVILDLARAVVSVYVGGNDAPAREYDLAATTTLTCTITVGANAAIVISQ